MVEYDMISRVFRISTRNMTYLISVDAEGRLVNRYWGAFLRDGTAIGDLLEDLPLPETVSDHAYRPNPLEYRAQEPHHFDTPALVVRFADGARGARLVYDSHSIEKDLAVVTLRDENYPLFVDLRYQVYGGLDLLSRSAVIRNMGENPVTLLAAHSATVNLPEGGEWRLTHRAGHWGREYQKQEVILTQSRTVLENTRGVCAAHQHVPFFALDARGEATESYGEVYYGVLHWSGDFKLTIEKNYCGQVSVTGGIGEFEMEWTLNKGESFETPMLTIGFSAGGFDHMTETLYDWQYDYLCPREKAYKGRPVIYNSWYPYEFLVNEENMLGLVGKAQEIGCELFVIDDGWMPGRVNEHAGLGDWVVDLRRFPTGLAPITAACHERGMMFGLWIEPEMVNPDSELYRAHPEWVLHDAARPRSTARGQLILNFARDDVREYAIECIDRLIEQEHLDYVKWDMNRYIGESGWPDLSPEEKGQIRVRYIRNVYSVWEHMNKKFPHVLLENCASGGGRADFGMVPYADRINRSDNADPVDVLLLHEGFVSLFVPKTAGGAGNIANSPNGINGRTSPSPSGPCLG